jgi:hypothetical protein
MALLSIRQRRTGRPRSVRDELSQEFLDSLAASGSPGYLLAQVGGWNSYPTLSAFLHQRLVPRNPVTTARFYRIADALKFPRERVFVNGARP